MPSQWSIRILDGPGGDVVFWPFVPGKNLGDPLIAAAGDLVTWNNMSTKKVALTSINPANVYLTEPMAPGDVSDPIFKVTQPITYGGAGGTHSIQFAPSLVA